MKSTIIRAMAAVYCLTGVLAVMFEAKAPIQWGTILLLAALLAALYWPPNRAVRVFFYVLFAVSAGIGITVWVYLFGLWLVPLCDENGLHCAMPMMHLFFGLIAACVLTPLLLYAYARYAGHRYERGAVGVLLAAAVLCGAASWLGAI